MNSRIIRKICGNISIGSKMKEMKSYDFATIKIPKFKDSLKEKIGDIYYNKIEKSDFNINEYLDNEKRRNLSLGIFQLNVEIIEIKTELEKLINLIIKEKPIEF